jgi:hypothetical protein
LPKPLVVNQLRWDYERDPLSTRAERRVDEVQRISPLPKEGSEYEGKTRLSRERRGVAFTERARGTFNEKTSFSP